MMADAQSSPYQALRSLDEAQAFPDAVVILEGDYGDQVYVTCPVQRVRCSEAELDQLLRDLDALEWDDPQGASVFYERVPTGAGVAGGMGGGEVAEGVWVHDRLARVGLVTAITDVVEGRTGRISSERP